MLLSEDALLYLKNEVVGTIIYILSIQFKMEMNLFFPRYILNYNFNNGFDFYTDIKVDIWGVVIQRDFGGMRFIVNKFIFKLITCESVQ